MIQILDKSKCCGCTACSQVCPQKCIIMKADNQGFLYPDVNGTDCINCNLCEKVCPILNQDKSQNPLRVIAAKNSNAQVREQSSSGGIFTSLAEVIINNGGVVYGARFNDNWEVVHSYTETKEGISAFRGSKYVQSNLTGIFSSVKNHLTSGKQVLFTGTPCQNAGLKKFLRKDYENLYTVDVVCHGVPSPLIWNEYIKYLSKKNNKCLSDIKSINFRDKSYGWYSYKILINWKDKCYSKSKTEDLFMLGFLKDLYLRPSCEKCPAKSGKSKSDITIGDFWGINEVHPEIYDNKGVTMVLLNSEKGLALFEKIKVIQIKTSYSIALKLNPVLNVCCKHNDASEKFWIKYNEIGIKALEKLISISKKQKIKRLIRETIYSFKQKYQNK